MKCQQGTDINRKSSSCLSTSYAMKCVKQFICLTDEKNLVSNQCTENAQFSQSTKVFRF